MSKLRSSSSTDRWSTEAEATRGVGEHPRETAAAFTACSQQPYSVKELSLTTSKALCLPEQGWL
jgi:hypothetical protein